MAISDFAMRSEADIDELLTGIGEYLAKLLRVPQQLSSLTLGTLMW